MFPVVGTRDSSICFTLWGRGPKKTPGGITLEVMDSSEETQNMLHVSQTQRTWIMRGKRTSLGTQVPFARTPLQNSQAQHFSKQGHLGTPGCNCFCQHSWHQFAVRSICIQLYSLIHLFIHSSYFKVLGGHAGHQTVHNLINVHSTFLT